MKPLSRALLLLALVLAAINLRPGITSLSPLIERIAEELALSRGLISLTTALPVLCMGLLAPLAPRLAVRFGLERVISACLGLIGLAMLARLGSHASSVLIGSSVVMGAGIAVAGPLLSGFIKRHFHDQVGRVVAWYSLSMTLGGAAGAVVTPAVTQLLADRWHFGLAFWALPAILALLLWLRIPNRADPEGEAEPGGLPWGEPRAWLITAFFAIQAGLFYALTTWLVARYHEAGLSLLHSNSLFGLFMLVGLPSAFGLPWLAQRFDNRYQLLLACGLLSTLCLGMISWQPMLLPELWAGLLGLGLSGSFALSLVLPLYEAHTPLAVSRWTAMMLFAGYSLACLTPILMGLGRDLAGSYQQPFMVITGLALVMCLLAWMLGRPRR
ncbi:CynX/NimT family MFS transporter [Metapseudomonas resinovorans]|uniref:Putative major facilitator superfamily transporter n=1 Tax=Metapseudomonas resinovorans NBRC 106553 TaxID=1245471 RepID=S6ANA0_METRE|nr:MFS transporter [Pseudomonas resinovorans]BAN47033.1 putative major facilitator superfamily transporter [Pseudomonas resinovorans NBRC 106553]